MQSEWVSWVMYKDENERWGKCTSSLRRAIDSDAPVMATNVSISCCDGLAIVVDFPKASERERERKRGLVCALAKRKSVRFGVVWILRLFWLLVFFFLGLKLNSEDGIYTYWGKSNGYARFSFLFNFILYFN